MRHPSNALARTAGSLGLPFLLLLILAACGSDSSESDSAEPAAATSADVTPATAPPPDETAAPTDADHGEGDDDGDHEDHDHDDGDGDHDDESSDEQASDAVRLDEARRLLVVAAHDQAVVDLIDLADGSAESIELDAPAAFSSTITESGRFLLAGHEDAVTVVDTGVWSEPHGDHFDHYTSTPTIVGRVDGLNPTHLISHDDLNALWFDGTGTAVVVAEESLEDGEVTVTAEVPTGQPHHGFAVPTHDEYFLTVPTEDMEHMPNVVGVSADDGVVHSQFDCPMTHGEASLADGAAAACSDGIILVRQDAGAWTGTKLAYPQVDDEDPYGFGPARAWILQASADHGLLAAPLGAQNLVIADPDDETTRSIDLEQNVSTLGVKFTDDGHLIVLTLDGFVHLVDPDDGSVVTSLEVITPFQEGDPDQPYRQLAVTGDHVYVTDPATDQIIEIALGDDLTVERTIDLEFTPGLLAIANG